MKSLAEINQEHARNASEIMLAYEDAKQRLRNTTELAQASPYALSDGERRRLLEEEKRQQAKAAYESTQKAYAEEVKRYHVALDKRRSQLRDELYGGLDDETLVRITLASDKDLERLLNRALLGGNEAVAKAVFGEAHQRGAGELVSRYLNDANPDARPLYEEWTELPSQETLERQVETIDRVVQPPDYARLMPYAQATT